MSGLSIAEESQIIALLARGDTAAQIRAHLLDKYGRPVTPGTITRVKRRNAENLAMIKTKTMAKADSDATALKHQANNTLKKRLDYEEQAVVLLNKASQQYIDNEISHEDYLKMIKSIKTASIPELVSISREMHTQSGSEQPPQSNPEDMAKLAAAIQNGDEVTLNQIVFNRGNTNPPQK